YPLHDRQHAGVRHRYRGADPSRRRNEQPRSRQRYLWRPLSSGGSAAEAVADRERLLVSARRSRPRRRGRHEGAGILEQGGARRAIEANLDPMSTQEPRSCDLLLANGCLLTMDARRTIISRGAIAIAGHTIAAVG